MRGFLVFLLLSFVACQNRAAKSSPMGKGSDLLGPLDGPASADISGELNDALASGGAGSGNQPLTAPEQQALKNLALETPKSTPKDVKSAGLSPELVGAFDRLSERARRGEDTSAERVALAGQILSQCATKADGGAPLPNYPLMGIWSGPGCIGSLYNPDDEDSPIVFPPLPIAFEVGGLSHHDQKNWVNKTSFVQGELTRDVSGGPAHLAGFIDWTNGGTNAGLAGRGVVASQVKAELNDEPQAGRGTFNGFPWYDLSNPYLCTMEVTLTESRNPYPAIFTEVMKRVGYCYKQAATLLNPVFDEMFRGLDPKVAALVKEQMLGISP